MVTVTAQNAAIQLVTGSAVSTDYMISYDVINNFNQSAFTRDFNPPWGSLSGNITTATTTSILTVPDTVTSYRIKEITATNRHASSSQTVAIVKYVASSATTHYLTPAITLLAGEFLIWTSEQGLRVFDTLGRIKTSGLSVRAPQVMSNPAFQQNDITSTTLLGPGWCVASYMGKAPRALEWATVRTKITTAVSVGAGEWAQVAIATGDVVVGGNPTLTVRGFASVEGTWNSTGLKSTIVSTTGINEGDNLWVLAGCSGGTGAITVKVQAGLADNLQTGAFALVSNEPNQIVGTPTVFTLLGATVSVPQFALVT